MKSYFLKIVFLALFSLTFAGISSGQSIDVCFDLNITDDCSGEWNGKYAARVSVVYSGNSYCVHTFYNLSDGTTNDLTYSCSELPLDYISPVYTVTVPVCRQEEDPECCGSDQEGPMHYYDLDDCDYTLDVTLSD